MKYFQDEANSLNSLKLILNLFSTRVWDDVFSFIFLPHLFKLARLSLLDTTSCYLQSSNYPNYAAAFKAVFWKMIYKNYIKEIYIRWHTCLFGLKRFMFSSLIGILVMSREVLMSFCVSLCLKMHSELYSASFFSVNSWGGRAIPYYSDLLWGVYCDHMRSQLPPAHATASTSWRVKNEKILSGS